MKNSLSVSFIFRTFLRETSGNVAMMFALLLVPLVMTIGYGAQYGIAMNYKHQLQSAVDAAALAGASTFTPTSGTNVPIGVAGNYMTKYIGTILPASLGVTYNATAATVSSQGVAQGYTVTVNATAHVPVGFGSLLKVNATTISVTATAENPVLTAKFDMGGFVSYACDNNALYWYIVPPNGGVPDASTMQNVLWDNNDANPPNATSFSILANQKIGFAMKNVTGARPASVGGCNYSNNMYGAQSGDTQWFYSSMEPPSAAYNIAPGGTNSGTHGTYPTDQDCSLVVEKGTTSQGVTTYPAAPQGSCYTASGTGENGNNPDGSFCYGCFSGATMDQMMGVTSKGVSAAAPSCAGLGGSSYQYDWNDMGAGTDSVNYGNDMQYTFSCAGTTSSGSSSGVYLVQ